MDGTGGYATPLKVFWWKGVPNFGDALSPLVVSHVSGRAVTHAGARGCDLLAIGSLLQVMRRNYREARADGVRPVIWGAGLLHAVTADFLDNVDIRLLRGPVSAALLGVKATRHGDPGLLADRLLRDRPERQDRIVVIPHHTQTDDPAIRALAEADPAITLADPGEEPLSLCRRIAAARHVVASSLHGLILADAFGVGSTWMDPGAQSHLKYHDYAAGIGRDMRAPVAVADVPALIARLPDGDGLAHAEGVAQAREALIETFPAHLRAGADMPAEGAAQPS